MSFRLSRHVLRVAPAKYVLQIPSSDGTAVDYRQSSFGYQPTEVARIDATVPMEVSEQSLPRTPDEVDGKQSTTGFEHATRLPDGLDTSGPREVVQHDGAQHHVESRIGKRKRLRRRNLECNVHSGTRGFALRPRDHFR